MNPPLSSGPGTSLRQAGYSATGTGSCQQHRCLLYIKVFHVLIPSLSEQKAKIPPKKPLQTSWSLQTPAINRPLIGGCNRIQFISRSDGLTFIITRGSACRELWAIHSLVEINCITSAQYLSSAQGTPMGAARTSFPPPRCEPSFGETLSPSHWTETAAFISHFWKHCVRVPSCCRHRGGRPPHQSRTSPRHRRHTHCSSPRPGSSGTDPSFQFQREL